LAKKKKKKGKINRKSKKREKGKADLTCESKKGNDTRSRKSLCSRKEEEEGMAIEGGIGIQEKGEGPRGKKNFLEGVVHPRAPLLLVNSGW